MNLLPALFRVNGGQRAAEIKGGGIVALPPQLAGNDGQPILVGIRPEHLTVGANGLHGRVALVEPLGSQVQIIADVAGREVTALLNERILPRVGADIALAPRLDAIHAFDADSGRRL
jgi:multiple sugar transport system ATP-binding protein